MKNSPAQPGSPLFFLAATVLVLVVFGVYARSLDYDFVSFDDYGYIVENDQVRQGLNWEGLAYSFRFTGVSYWHPMALLSHMADVEMWGMDGGKHHLTSILVHMANTFLVFWALFILTGSGYRSLLVAALFGLHPINVDSVSWIAERKNLLSCFFWLWCLIFYAKWTRKHGAQWYILLVISMALGLMSKPTVMPLPAILLLLDWWPLGRWKNGPDAINFPARARHGFWRLALEKAPLFALAGGSFLLSILSLQVKGVEKVSNAPMVLRLENALVSFPAYLEKLFWPYPLAWFYPFPRQVENWRVAASLFFLLAVFVLVFKNARKRPWLVVGWLWFFITMFQASGIIQAGLWPAMSDRFAYIPFLGLFVLLAWLMPGTAGRNQKKIWGGVFLFWVLALAGAAFFQISTWKNSETLYTHAIKVTQDNYTAHNNLGIWYMNQGRLDPALEHFTRAFAISPGFDETSVNLGNVWLRKGEPKKAIRYYRTALGIRPDRALTHTNLGTALLQSGDLKGGETHLARGIALSPDDPSAYNNLGVLLMKQGRLLEADFLVNRALALSPDFVQARKNRAKIQNKREELQADITRLRAKAKAAPRDRSVLSNMGIVQYYFGDLAGARQTFEQLLATDPQNAHYTRFVRDMEKAVKQRGDLASALGIAEFPDPEAP